MVDATKPVTPAARRAHPPITTAAQELLAPKPEWIPPRPSALELTIGVGTGTAAAIASPLLGPAIAKIFAPLSSDPASFLPTPEEMGDPGWFGPESVAWQVHTDNSLLVAGIAAFTLQSLHPLAMAGVAEHSAFSTDFLGRTKRTGEFVQGVVFGSSADAERRCHIVNNVHKRVIGVAPDGRPYDALDPELLHWVHITEYLTIAAANRRFGIRPMSRHQLDTYIAEVARVGEAVGVLDPPRSWAELLAGVERHRPNLAIGEYAAAGIGFLDDPPIIPAPAKPAWRLLWQGAMACLPPIALDLLNRQPPGSVQLTATRALLRTLGALGNDPPPYRAARIRLGLDR